MAKITFMGAGSTVFARNVLGDCMCSPALYSSEIALYDIDAQRLEDSQIILSAINHNVNQDRACNRAIIFCFLQVCRCIATGITRCCSSRNH